jgi:GNAT superfamily N-acetyltransferase
MTETEPRQAALLRIPATRRPVDAAATETPQAALRRIRTTWIPVDGAVVVARPTADTDQDQICDLHLRCSYATRYHRYHCGLKQPTASMLENMTDRGKGLYLAVHEPQGQMVGLCGLAFTELPSTLELGLLVADDWQGRGIGRAACELLLSTARAAGFERVTAHVLAENRRAVALLSRMGAQPTERAEPRVVSRVFMLTSREDELV